ncbi:hypothetical protein [Okeania sp. SIO2G4]|uniref:hypothetical protein n=1 Tax=Okeania sp. SIO2G4 TaxID=2607793 RepID=UPI00258055A7|nr:hypothetical protein [Okeania sp. SIO2G4]
MATAIPTSPLDCEYRTFHFLKHQPKLSGVWRENIYYRNSHLPKLSGVWRKNIYFLSLLRMSQ